MVRRFKRACRRHTFFDFFHELLCAGHLPCIMWSHVPKLETCSRRRNKTQKRNTIVLSSCVWYINCDGFTGQRRDTPSPKGSDVTKIGIFCSSFVHNGQLGNYRINVRNAGKRVSHRRQMGNKHSSLGTLIHPGDEVLYETVHLPKMKLIARDTKSPKFRENPGGPSEATSDQKPYKHACRACGMENTLVMIKPLVPII